MKREVTQAIDRVLEMQSTSLILSVSLRIELLAGTEITKAANAAWILCLHAGLPVSFDFNGIVLTIHPNQPSDDIVRLYTSKLADKGLGA